MIEDRKEHNKQETKKRTIKSLIFLGIIMLLFLIGEVIKRLG